MLYLGKSTVYRIVVGWAGFIETFLSQLNIEPSQGYLLKNMTDVFVKARHGMADMVIECTEFKFQLATNLDLNTLIF